MICSLSSLKGICHLFEALAVIRDGKITLNEVVELSVEWLAFHDSQGTRFRS